MPTPAFALGPGDACYVNNAKAYDDAFATFFARLAADGITPANTLFVINSEENDHFAGGNTQPRPGQRADTGRLRRRHRSVPYAAGQIGELSANLPGLLPRSSATPRPSTSSRKAPRSTCTASLARAIPRCASCERDVANITADNPYNGTIGEKIVNYQAGKIEQRILHIETADPLRTPTFTVFPKGDYFFGQGPQNCTTPCVSTFSRFAWDHGYYSPNIDITWNGDGRPQRRSTSASTAPNRRSRRRSSTRPATDGSGLQWHRHVGGSDRHPPDVAVPRRLARRLPH